MSVTMWENERSGTARSNYSERPLTHSLDYGEEGLAMKATRTCSIEACERKHLCRGWCKFHWQRWYRSGDPLAVTYIRGDHETRFWTKVDKNGPVPAHRPDLGPCWSWKGMKLNGYGRFGVNGKTHLAYRWAFERFVSPVAPGLKLDHLCHNRGCVNYEAHLEPVTHQENCRRRRPQ